jgi:hypothetical protein
MSESKLTSHIRQPAARNPGGIHPRPRSGHGRWSPEPRLPGLNDATVGVLRIFGSGTRTSRRIGVVRGLITDDDDDEWHGTNAFIRDGDSAFRTYFINNRGDEARGSTSGVTST